MASARSVSLRNTAADIGGRTDLRPDVVLGAVCFVGANADCTFDRFDMAQPEMLPGLILPQRQTRQYGDSDPRSVGCCRDHRLGAVVISRRFARKK